MKFHKALTLIFITLKLTHFIYWSWWWVLSPIITAIVLEVIQEQVKNYSKKDNEQ